jgi:hypothetical protein
MQAIRNDNCVHVACVFWVQYVATKYRNENGAVAWGCITGRQENEASVLLDMRRDGHMQTRT